MQTAEPMASFSPEIKHETKIVHIPPSEVFSFFAETQMKDKYAHPLNNGEKETWAQIAKRVATEVMKAVNAPQWMVDKIEVMIRQRKFMPGGRYLYATGLAYHQTQNCLLLRAEDSREGWADLLHKATMALMSGAGIGVVYSDVRPRGSKIKKTLGTSTGPIALMEILNNAGRGIMQGGSRRSAIWAGLHWNHPDVHEFIKMKNWSPEVRALKEKDYNFPAPMDGTNISVILDDVFFEAFHNSNHQDHSLAHSVYWAVVRQMLETAEPGFSIDVGPNNGENLRNACVTGDTEILTRDGYKRIDSLVDKEVTIWNGFEWSKVTPKVTGHNQEMLRLKFNTGQTVTCTRYHKFIIAKDYKGAIDRIEAENLKIGDKLMKNTFPVIEHGEACEFAYTQGFLSGDGMEDASYLNLYWTKKMCASRMHGQLTSWNEDEGRGHFKFNFEPLSKTFVPFKWNLKSKLDWLAGILDSDGTELKEGGTQLGSVNKTFLENVQKLLHTLGIPSKITNANKAGYRPMPDGNGGTKEYFCQDSYRLCIGAVQIQDLKKLGLKCERLEFNKEPQRDASQFVKIVAIEDAGVESTVYCFTEPKRNSGIFNGVFAGNCTEITSRDDSDICNLGSINMARVSSLEEMKELVDLGTAFLLAGTVYSHVPYEKVNEIRTKNRRLGLGLLGLHEWLLQRHKSYGPDKELEKYLEVYATSGESAAKYAGQWGISSPVKTRAVAPTGTIGICAETTTGIEPIFCVAYKRRYLKNQAVNYQYVIDPTAERLINQGVEPEFIEDAYTLAQNVERRVEFQAWVQQYVDHAISSTINLPSWGSEYNNEFKVTEFGNMLIKYLPKLRGITCYPDGSRGNQPLTPVSYRTAIRHVGQIFIEQADVCDISKKGSCG